jgi:DNA-directed RNA polymerase beta subunit
LTKDLADRYFNKVLSRVNFDIGAKMANFLATGNLVSPTGLDLQQASGFTIIAEKLNWQRYISHFRSIHRGAFFAELKTTTVRKLLPEAWGQSESLISMESVDAFSQGSSVPFTLQMALPAAC